MSARTRADFLPGWRHILLAGLLVFNTPAAQAVTCTWNSAIAADWHLPSNWSGCAAGNGTPAGTPGPADRAVFPSGAGKAIIVPQFTTIAELDMAPGSELGLVEAQTDIRQLIITGSTALSGATLSGALPPPGGPNPAYLSLQLPEGSTLSFTGSNLLRRAIITNAGNATFNGGAGVRLNLDVNGGYTNAPIGNTTVLGAYVFGYSTSGTISNQGTWIHQGPGLVEVERSGASGGQFSSTGTLELRSGTFSFFTPSPGFQGSSTGSLRLVDGVLDFGSHIVGIASGKVLSGSGTVMGTFNASSGGIIDPDADAAGAIGALNFVGNVLISGTDLVLDVHGPAVTEHDRLSINGSVQWNRVTPHVRINAAYAPGIDTAIAIATHSSVLNPNTPVHNRVLSDYPLSLALRVAPTQTDLRVVPTIAIPDVAVVEGSSGTQTMNFVVTLSAPTSETVSFGYTTAPGTAVTSGSQSDFVNGFGSVTIAPGVISQQIPVTIKGDTAAEADEAFALVTDDNASTPTLKNASFGNYRKFSAGVEGLIRDDDSATGTRYLLIGKSTNQATPTGQVSFVRRYTTTGVAVDGWATKMQNSVGHVATGFCRAPNGDVLSTRFNDSRGVVLMSPAGAVLDEDFGGLLGQDESCAFDLSGNAWVGEAGPVSATTYNLHYMAGDGRLLKTLQVPVGERGTDWIELDADQCTLYYTSEDSDVRRFDVCAEQALPHFATGLEPRCYALRQLPDHDLMITCTNRIYRYDQNGAFVREYTRQSLGETDPDGLYAIQIDPDGQTFWTGGATSGRVVRARLDDGSVVTSFNTGTGGINGLLIQDEFVSAISLLLFKDGFEP
jgi:Calx-beta domain